MAEKNIKISIDNMEVTCKAGATILSVARGFDIFIPTMCDDPRLDPYGGCRLCVVDIKGVEHPQTSCTTPVVEGMEIVTMSERLKRIRKNLIELLLSNHPNDCMRCEVTGDCTLQDLAYRYNADWNRFEGEKTCLPLREDNDFITFEPDKCILCGRCVRICDEVMAVGTIDLVGKGFDTTVDTAWSKPRTRDNCEFCGQCVSTCPTGALTDKMSRGLGRPYETTKVRTTCCYCGTGCGLDLKVKDNKVIGVASAMDAPSNLGNLCIKGRYAYRFIHSPERIKTPLIKRNGKFEEASWDEALDLVAGKFSGYRKKYGPDAVGGVASSRCTSEDVFTMLKWIRAGIGTNNIDNCARV